MTILLLVSLAGSIGVYVGIGAAVIADRDDAPPAPLKFIVNAWFIAFHAAAFYAAGSLLFKAIA